MSPPTAARHRAAVGGDTGFEVEPRRTGQALTVAADSTVPAAARRELPDTAHSCEQGFRSDRLLLDM
ncbi:hypothetical protein [Streptomyces sp. Ru62]|uniref:hypothetical protein n=1 Tax=Streptomyces sp. Ru62 TaxID=2080745 RepID=UPI0035BC06EE